MRHRSVIRRASTKGALLFLPALFVPGAAESQSTAAERGGGSSFGRISGGGGSYGHLTHGFTARRPSARIPINAVTRANGTANEPRRGRTERIPINAQTIANGTANTWREPQRDRAPGRKPIHRPRRGPFLVDARPFYQYVAASRMMVSPYVLQPGEDPAGPRRRLGRLSAPTRSVGEAKGAKVGAPEGAGDIPEPMAPRVKPPVPTDEATAKEVLPPGQCAVVRVTTVGGIQWRQRIRLPDYDVSTPGEAANLLQEVLKRGDPLSIHGPDGSFTVRASLVQSLIVGPCRGF